MWGKGHSVDEQHSADAPHPTAAHSTSCSTSACQYSLRLFPHQHPHLPRLQLLPLPVPHSE